MAGREVLIAGREAKRGVEWTTATKIHGRTLREIEPVSVLSNGVSGNKTYDLKNARAETRTRV
jgi:hypothetical protein